MKELKEYIYHNDKYDIDIRQYLTNAEIEAIAQSLLNFKTYGERKENYDLLLLHFCTNIDDEEIKKTGMEMIEKSGLMDVVENNVKNAEDVFEALTYYESTARAISQILEKLPIDKAVKKNAKNTSKK